jgi:hypothetical protein
VTAAPPPPGALVEGVAAVTLPAAWLAVVVAALPTVVTVLPTTTTGAVGLPDPERAGAGEPDEPPAPEPGGPLWGPARTGTTVTVVPGGTSTVTAGGGPLCPAWADDAPCAALAPARPGDNVLGEREPPPGSRCEPARELSPEAPEP